MYAATAGGAAALDRDDVGRLVPGPRADLVLLDAPSHVHLAYRPGVPLVAGTWVGRTPLRPVKPQVSGPEVALEATHSRAEIRHLPDVRAYLRGGISSHTGNGPGSRKGTAMNDDLLVNAEIEYRVNRIREDWRPIRARRAPSPPAPAGGPPPAPATWIG